jgi:hypothetical protein
MNKKTSNKNKTHRVPLDIYNQYIKITQDPDFQALLKKAIPILNDPDSDDSFDYIKAVENFIKVKKLPLNWKQPILNMLRYNAPDFPLDNGIEIKVGDNIITANHSSFIVIKNNKSGDFDVEKKISIVITSKMKTEKILEFIRNFQTDIEHWQNLLNFPDFYKSNWKKMPLALAIFVLKDEKGLSFAEIATKLSSDEKLTLEEIEYLASCLFPLTFYN